MKAFLIGGSFILAMILGFFPNGISGKKPFWWKIIILITGLLTIICGLGINIGGSFVAVSQVAVGRGSGSKSNLYGKIETISQGVAKIIDNNGNSQNIKLSNEVIGKLKVGDNFILETSFDRITKEFLAHRIIATNPAFVLPLIPALEERSRNLYFHVPTAWITQIAWFIAFGFAVAYLRTKNYMYDIISESVAAVGLLFCILATTTGAIWAKFNWGTFWNWDPRQTSIFLVLIIYGAYFALRSSISTTEQKSKISAVYLILLCLPVVFLMFVLPRIMQGLHPGSLGDSNTGPVLSPQADALDINKQIIYAISLFHFILLYFWITNILIRTKIINYKIQNAISN